MRHRKKGRKLSRTSAHREALRRNMARALLEHERIVTTEAKAKEVRPFVEKVITLARRAMPYKDGAEEGDRAKYLHYYRQALKKLQDVQIVRKLFGEGDWRQAESLGERYLHRPGGYTRIVKLGGSRLGRLTGDSVGKVSEITYEIGGVKRTLKLIGNSLGDNAPRVLFELVEKELPASQEEEEQVAPVVSLSEETETTETEQSAQPQQDTAESAAPEEPEASAPSPSARKRKKKE